MEPNIPTDPQSQTPVQSATSQSTQTPIEPKKSLPKWPLIIVGIILLATLLTGTYLLGKNQSTSQKQTVTPTPIGSPKPTAEAADPTANWKTYINNQLGFSFKYPPAWIENTTPLPDTTFTVSMGAPDDCNGHMILNTDEKPCNSPAGGGFEGFEVALNENPKHLSTAADYANWTVENFINNYYPNNPTAASEVRNEVKYSKEPINLQFSNDWIMTRSAIGAGSAQEMFIVKNGSIFDLICGGCDNNLTNTILQTFKFTDQPISAQPLSKEGESCGENAGAGGNAQCSPGLSCTNINSTTKIGTCIKQ